MEVGQGWSWGKGGVWVGKGVRLSGSRRRRTSRWEILRTRRIKTQWSHETFCLFPRLLLFTKKGESVHRSTLAQVIFPTFVHIYLDFVAGGHSDVGTSAERTQLDDVHQVLLYQQLVTSHTPGQGRIRGGGNTGHISPQPDITHTGTITEFQYCSRVCVSPLKIPRSTPAGRDDYYTIKCLSTQGRHVNYTVTFAIVHYSLHRIIMLKLTLLVKLGAGCHCLLQLAILGSMCHHIQVFQLEQAIS